MSKNSADLSQISFEFSTSLVSMSKSAGVPMTYVVILKSSRRDFVSG
ncbi:MAG: hypothetical protein XD88_1935 [Methanocalculus sp. 52_23]|jgi:hypothetical protein|nr:hypothetical protein [Methanocalculus sp.]KUK68385.1 MAG: hypothetical protein XD88_1935 [Methanocalculus sp. 52_23]HIJ06842.1 hypothetical protein [Methanocalculus sp.]